MYAYSIRPSGDTGLPSHDISYYVLSRYVSMDPTLTYRLLIAYTT